MNRKIKVTAAIVVVVAMLLSACQEEKEKQTFTGNTVEEAAYQGLLDAVSPSAYSDVQGLDLEPGSYISIIGKAEEAPFWQKVKAGVMQAAEDLNKALGYTGSDKVKVTYNAPGKEEDIDEQVNILDEELARYPDVIGIASVDEDACSVQFDLAAGNDIPIIALDSGNSYQGIQCIVKTDNADAARTGAYKLADEIDDEGEVILLVHDSKSESAKEREASFREEMSTNHPNITIVETIYCDKLEELKKMVADEVNADVEAEEDKIVAYELTDLDVICYYMDKYPNLKGMFGTSSAATQLGVEAIRQQEENIADKTAAEESTEDAVQTEEKEAVQPENAEDEEEQPEEPVKIILMGFDAGKDQLDALESGEISGLVVQNPFGMGYASVIAAARAALESGNEAVVNTGYTWVTKENMSEEAIQKMLYE